MSIGTVHIDAMLPIIYIQKSHTFTLNLPNKDKMCVFVVYIGCIYALYADKWVWEYGHGLIIFGTWFNSGDIDYTL